jgi:hypothetical protein
VRDVNVRRLSIFQAVEEEPEPSDPEQHRDQGSSNLPGQERASGVCLANGSRLTRAAAGRASDRSGVG